MRFIITTLLILISSSLLKAQSENNIWYFGEYAGLDFNSEPPEPLTNGALNTIEGCAAISTSSGAILFYTDGVSVWNKNHQTMPNGKGLFGSSSSTQAAIIVPDPGNQYKFYIFTLVEQAGPQGLRYSTVDIRLDSGLGDIVKKNILLHSPGTEKLSSALHNNMADYWVLSHDWGNNNFRAYKIDENGVSAPVISPVGPDQTGLQNTQSMGYLRFSPDGARLAIVNRPNVELYNFDNKTGKVSTPIIISPTGMEEIYGLEFSPDAKLLYVTSFGSGQPSRIFQYDIEKYTESDIQKSEALIAETSGREQFGAIQLGPDKKMYIAKSYTKFLDLIEYPSKKGANCSYISNAIGLAERECKLGLPNHVRENLAIVALSSNSPVCLGSDIHIYCDTILQASYSWTGPNGFKSKEISPVITNANSDNEGAYRLTITYKNGKTRKESIEIVVINSGLDLSEFKDIDFGRACLNSYMEREIQLENTSDWTIDIDNIELSNTDFTLNSNITAPALLEPGEMLTLTVSFYPTEQRIYSDSLFININSSNYCSLSANITGEGIGRGLVLSLPDTIAKAGENNFCIPLSASLSCFDENTNYGLDYEITVGFDATLFAPAGDLVIEDGKRLVNFSGAYRFDGSQAVIADLCGAALLGDAMFTPITIESYSFSDSTLDVFIYDGSLGIEGVCRPDIRRVQKFEKYDLIIYPIPASESLKYKIVGKTKESQILKIYSVHGEEFAEYNLPDAAGELNLSDLPSGIYTAILYIDTEKIAKPLIISK